MLRRLKCLVQLKSGQTSLTFSAKDHASYLFLLRQLGPDLYFWQQLLTFGSRNCIESTVTHLKNEVVNKTLGSKLLWITLRPIDVSKI